MTRAQFITRCLAAIGIAAAAREITPAEAKARRQLQDIRAGRPVMIHEPPQYKHVVTMSLEPSQAEKDAWDKFTRGTFNAWMNVTRNGPLALAFAAALLVACQDETREPRPDPVNDRIKADSIQVGPTPIVAPIPDCWPEPDGNR